MRYFLFLTSQMKSADNSSNQQNGRYLNSHQILRKHGNSHLFGMNHPCAHRQGLQVMGGC